MPQSRAATHNLAGTKFAGQSRGARPSAKLLQRMLMLRDHPICAQIYAMSRLLGIKPARTVMVATALFQLVVSISRLAGAVAAMALFSGSYLCTSLLAVSSGARLRRVCGTLLISKAPHMRTNTLTRDSLRNNDE